MMQEAFPSGQGYGTRSTRWFWAFTVRYGLWTAYAEHTHGKPFRYAITGRSRAAVKAALKDVEAWNSARGWYPVRHWR